MYSLQNLPANSGRFHNRCKVSLRIPDDFATIAKPPCEFRTISQRLQSLPANSGRFPNDYKASLRIPDGFPTITKPPCEFWTVLQRLGRLPEFAGRFCIEYKAAGKSFDENNVELRLPARGAVTLYAMEPDPAAALRRCVRLVMSARRR
jgi:hypothetical protein